MAKQIDLKDLDIYDGDARHAVGKRKVQNRDSETLLAGRLRSATRSRTWSRRCRSMPMRAAYREARCRVEALVSAGPAALVAVLEAILNQSRVHKEHERFYSSSPLETALRLQRHARTLQALADRWTIAEPASHRVLSPYEGADDLNSEAAVALDGALFLEGEGRPAEITAMIGELRVDADGFLAGGQWLATAMQAAWDGAAAVLDVNGLADVLGERHRIITNDWLAAHMQSLIGQMLARAADMLEHIDLTPAALRADLAGARVTPPRVHSAAEVISRAADLCCESSRLVHDNERRWRVFRERVNEVVQAMATGVGPATPIRGEDAPGSE
jgi:hypothetical protein